MLFYKRLRWGWAVLLLALLVTVTPARAAGIYTGTVFWDYNHNGVYDLTNDQPATGAGTYGAAVDAPVAAVNVTFYNAAGLAAGTTTDANGVYSFDPEANGLGAGPYRIEFTGYEIQTFFSGVAGAAFGTDSSTSVQFVPNGGGTYNFAVGTDTSYCQDDPQLVTPCYVYGDNVNPLRPDLPVLVSFPYGAGSANTAGNLGSIAPEYLAPTAHPISIPPQELGSVFGVTYERVSHRIFAAAYMKRHSGYGPGGIGQIYTISPNAAGAATTAEEFANLNTLLPADNPAGTDYRPAAGNDWLTDGGDTGWNSVGKIGLGGVAVDRFGQNLFVVALGNRTLYRISIPPVGTPVTAANITGQLQLPRNGCPGGGINARPFAVTYQVEPGQPPWLYVGVTCTGESSYPTPDTTNRTGPVGDRTLLSALVYRIDPQTLASPQLVATFPLNYPRGFADNAPGVKPEAEWLTWSPEYRRLAQGSSLIDIYPQPLLTQIAFDDNGDMILAVRDRNGDQVGYETASDPRDDTNLRRGLSAGDTLRLCRTAPEAWQPENAGTCRGTDGLNTVYINDPLNQNRSQGRGNGEYYGGDEFKPFFNPGGSSDPAPGYISGVSRDLRHDEIGLGGVFRIPGYPDAAVAMFDPIYANTQGFVGTYTGGVRWLDNQQGTAVRSYVLYTDPGGSPRPLFGKANGLGGLVALCEIAPLEVGNRVWLDNNANGVQDANDPGIDNVTVRLYEDTNGDGLPDGAAIAQTITASGGQYYFVEAGLTNGAPGTGQLPVTYNNGRWKYGTSYVVQLDNPADYVLNAPLFQLTITLLDTGNGDPANPNADIRDSDGIETPGNGTTLPVEYPRKPFTVGSPAEHNHTYDFGFYNPQLVVPPTPTYTPGGPTITPTYTPGGPTITPTYTPGGPTITPTYTPGGPTITPTYTPGGPTITPTYTPGGPTITPTYTPGGPTITPTYTPGGPTITPTYTPGGPTITPTYTPGGPTITPTGAIPPDGATATPPGFGASPTSSVTPGGPTITPNPSLATLPPGVDQLPDTGERRSLLQRWLETLRRFTAGNSVDNRE